MDSHQQKTVKVETYGKMKQKPKPDVALILHHNIQGINNKLLELNVLLQSELADGDVLCLSEHWLWEGHIKLILTYLLHGADSFLRS